MKIAFFDPNVYKFTQGIIDHWVGAGHEVKYTIYTDENMVAWSDVTYFETVDNNIRYWTQEHPEARPSRFAFCRGIDVDLWMQNPTGVNWGLVKTLVLPFEHTKEIIDRYMQLPETLQIKYIPFGVDLNKFTMSKHTGKNHRLLWAGDTWMGKHPQKAIEILHELVRMDPRGDWKLTILGDQNINRNPNYAWYLKYMENMVDILGYKDRVTFDEERAPDMNIYYDNFDYVLVTSFKEMFSYVAGEAMCKGIKPIIGHFWGADKIWPEEYLYWTPREAAELILETPYESEGYRQFIQDNYSLDRMLLAYDEIIK